MSPSCMIFPQFSMGSVLLADDHEMVGQGIARVLDPHFGAMTLVTSGTALLASIRANPPDVVVADISMPGMSGIDAMKQAKAEGYQMPFVFLTMHDEPSLAAEAVRSGGRGYILKSCAGDELIDALRAVARGGSFITPSVGASAMMSSSSNLHSPTERQFQVLDCIARGLRSREVADLLHLSVRTIESHKYAMMQILEVHGTLDLIRKARQAGWLKDPRINLGSERRAGGQGG